MKKLAILSSIVLAAAIAVTAQAAPPAAGMLDSARAFLAALSPEQRARAVYPFNSEERFRWFYTPVSRKGLPLKEMNDAQRKAALALLHAGLSEKGYSKAETIRRLEDVLHELEQGKGPTRDPDM